MGNCGFKGYGEVEEMVKVVTSSNGIMELYAPITAECITNEFPDHAIYRTPDDFFYSQPLLHNEELHAGHLYYLLPCNNNNNLWPTTSSSMNNNTNNNNTPYRMSFDQKRVPKRTTVDAAAAAAADVLPLPRYNNSTTGVWKVRLVISSEQLSEILATEARTEALIESVRTVAKCGNIGVSSSSSVTNSDQCSVSSSSWKESLGKFGQDRW